MKIANDVKVKALTSNEVNEMAQTLGISYFEMQKRLEKIAKQSEQSRKWRMKEQEALKAVKALLG
jgi:hypothetical protein